MSKAHRRRREGVGRGKLPAANRSLGLTLPVVGDEPVLVHSLPPSGELLIGRSESADIRIDHPSISRRHAVLHCSLTPSIEDLGSANGTRVGERTLRRGDRVAVGPGDVLELGAVVGVIQAFITYPHRPVEKMALFDRSRAESREAPLGELAPPFEAERRRILDALSQSAGNQTKAARQLGISRGTLLIRLETFRIPRPRKTSPFRRS